ncbi:MAG TPA: CHAP domain-containing protein [Candidatus Saccharimonadales bacterium]|nr:CHAP domain-containing protein [Candidatus Saccharimonadales bacterium]
MPKQNKQHRSKAFSALKSRVILFVLVGVMALGGISTCIRGVDAARATCGSISECNSQIAANDDKVANLQSEAVSYQDAVARLNGQIALIQGKINYNTAEQARLTKDIAKKQAELDRQREILGSDLKAMYLDDQMSTIEMLVTSKNLSDYVDREAYRSAVQSKLQSTLKEITALQTQLKSQKTQVENLLAEQRTQRTKLASARAEQSNLLAYNQSQQASFNAQTAANKKKLQELIEEQRRANAPAAGAAYYFIRFPGHAGYVNGNNYPYANAGFGMSTAPGCVDNDGPDPWGYCTRQCVSYAAWAVAASGRSAPMYYGNAKDWVGGAAAHGIPVYTSNPRPGDVAISTAGTWGHAMYVEKVSGSQIYVSEYNNFLTGQYYQEWRTWQ